MAVQKRPGAPLSGAVSLPDRFRDWSDPCWDSTDPAYGWEVKFADAVRAWAVANGVVGASGYPDWDRLIELGVVWPRRLQGAEYRAGLVWSSGVPRVPRNCRADGLPAGPGPGPKRRLPG